MSKYTPHKPLLSLMAILCVLASACAPAAPDPARSTAADTAEPTSSATAMAVATATAVPEPTATATAAAVPGPKTGGRAVVALPGEPDTLDPHNTVSALSSFVMQNLGASLLAQDLERNYVPYLAESWETSDDGLTWTFTLKEGITFHDGSPLTAHDFAWTYQRALDPERSTGNAGMMLGPVAAVEALDDLILQITLSEPFFPMLYALTSGDYLQPLSRAAVEAGGDEYGRNPVGVGGHRFVEWQTGEKIVVESNPDFFWGTTVAHPGPSYLGEIEYRIVPEYSTSIAGLEAGEIDYVLIEARDVDRLRADGRFQIAETLLAGAQPYVALNTSMPPFDDLRVRQAFNLAVDKEALLEIVARGYGQPQYGPISPAVNGYWDGVEEIGYRYDLERAKELMEEAGYTYNDEGMLEKDGEPLALTMKTRSALEVLVKTSEVLQEQYRALGVDITIEQQEYGVAVDDQNQGNYELAVTRILYPEADVLYLMYHSSQLGVMNSAQLSDPELDAILEKTRTATDPGERQEWVNKAQQRIVEQAYMVPLFTPKSFLAISNRIKGIVTSPNTGAFLFYDAYIEEEE